MEARSIAAVICVCGALSLAGCNEMRQSPSARPAEQAQPPVEERSEVVATETEDVQVAADVTPDPAAIERWAEEVSRVDDVRSRIALPPEPVPEPLSLPYDPSNVPDANVARVVEPLSKPVYEPAVRPAPAEVVSQSRPQPPALAGVSVCSVAVANETPPAEMHGESRPSGVNAPARAADQPITLEEFAERWQAAPGDTSFRGQLDQRLVQVLAGDFENAKRPLELASREQQRMATQFVDALMAIREMHGGEPSEEADRVLDKLVKLEESLVPLSDLQVPRLVLTRAVRGFGSYDPFEPAQFAAGRATEFVVYCEIGNFVSQLRDDGGYDSRFSMRTEVLSRAGDTVLDINDENIADTCRTRRRDCFIPRLVRLPATLSPGDYVVKVTIVDKIGAKVAQKKTTFRIVARS